MEFPFYNSNSNFNEEIADVKLCIDTIGDYIERIRYTEPIDCNGYGLTDTLVRNCNELSKAAIKLRRTMIPNVNPTPVSKNEAETNLMNAITNIKLCIDAIGKFWDNNITQRIYNEKATRWINRINKKQCNNQGRNPLVIYLFLIAYYKIV